MLTDAGPTLSGETKSLQQILDDSINRGEHLAADLRPLRYKLFRMLRSRMKTAGDEGDAASVQNCFDEWLSLRPPMEPLNKEDLRDMFIQVFLGWKPNTIKVFVDHGGVPQEKDSRMVISCLASSGKSPQQCIEILEHLTACGWDPSKCPVYVFGSKDGVMFKYLLEHGANPNTIIYRTWVIGDETPLIRCARLRSPTEVEALIAYGAAIENRAMHFTLREPNPHRLAIMSILLDHGADINAHETAARKENGGPLPRYRYTPVAEAVIRDDVEAVKYLIQRSANLLLKAEHVYERDYGTGKSALELIRMSKNEKIRELIPEEYREGGENA